MLVKQHTKLRTTIRINLLPVSPKKHIRVIMVRILQVRNPAEPGLSGVEPLDAERRAAFPGQPAGPFGTRDFVLVGEGFHAGLEVGVWLVRVAWG